MENVRQYLQALKAKSKITVKDWSTLSGVPADTIKNILSGKTEKNAGFITMIKIITSLGGDVNEAVGYEKKKEVELNSILSITESYEKRLEEMAKSYELRLEDMKNVGDLRVADVLKCCDIWVDSIRRFYEEQLKEQRQDPVR
jgi:hypothetical protein